MLPPIRQVRDSESDSYGGLGERSGLSVSRSIIERPLLRPDEILSMSLDRVIISGHAKPIDARRPDWSHWLPLCDPMPKTMEPTPVVEMLPTRTADGKYIDMPKEMVPRNPWAGIQHPKAPPEPEQPAEAPTAPTVAIDPGPVGLGGKYFDWKWERREVTPGRRTKVYPEPIGPAPLPKSLRPGRRALEACDPAACGADQAQEAPPDRVPEAWEVPPDWAEDEGTVEQAKEEDSTTAKPAVVVDGFEVV